MHSRIVHRRTVILNVAEWSLIGLEARGREERGFHGWRVSRNEFLSIALARVRFSNGALGKLRKGPTFTGRGYSVNEQSQTSSSSPRVGTRISHRIDISLKSNKVLLAESAEEVA